MQWKKNALWNQAELSSKPGFVSYYFMALCMVTDLCGTQFMICKTRKISLYSGLAAFPIKGETVNILSFVGHTVPVESTQFCCCSPKAVIDYTYSCA